MQASLRTPKLLDIALVRRFRGQPAWAAVTELFIGLGWLRAAVAKVIDPGWWTGDGIVEFAAAQTGHTLAWYAPFLDNVITPNAELVALVVMVSQLVAAAALLSGRARPLGLAVGITLNLHFMAAGAVNPSAFYLIAQGALALWLVEQWRRRPSHEVLSGVGVGGLATAAFNLPFIATLHPAEVIDDPAIMFAMLGGLTTLACVLTMSSSRLPDERSHGRDRKLADVRS